MNKLQRAYHTVQGVGWKNLPRRVWQTMQTRLGISRWRLPGGELPSEALRRQFVDDYDPQEAGQRYRARTRSFFFSPDHRSDLAKVLAAIADAQG